MFELNLPDQCSTGIVDKTLYWLKSVGCFPVFPERLWSVMTGSEVSHDVMTRPEADLGGDIRHCVSRPSPSSVWREGGQHGKDAVVTTLCVLFPDWPKLRHRVKDEEVRGETGDHITHDTQDLNCRILSK